MGSATSAEDKKRQQQEEKQQKRELEKIAAKQRKREAILKDHTDFTEDGTPFFFDEHGEKYYLDDELVPYYLDQEDKKYYYDKKGHKFYLDKRGRPFHVDKYGERCFWDKRGNPFYTSESGDIYYLDYDRKKYYLDEEGAPFYFDDTASKIWIRFDCIDDRGRVISRTRSRKTLKDIKSETKHRANTGVDIVPSFNETIGRGKVKFMAQPNQVLTASGSAVSAEPTSSSILRTASSRNSRTDTSGEARTTSSKNEASEDGLNFERYRTLTPEFDKYPDVPDEKDITYDDIAQAKLEADRKILARILKGEKEKGLIPSRKRYRKIGHYVVREKMDKRDCSITGSAFLPNGNLVISDFHNRNLKMYDPDLKFIADLDLNAYPENMCARALDFDVYVPFKTGVEYGIKVVKVKNHSLSLEKTLKTKGQCYGICSNNGGLAVIVNTVHGWQVHLLDLNGRVKKHIIMEDNNKPILKRPDYLSVTSDLRLLISDRGSNSVLCFDVWTETLVFTHTQIREPYGVTCDTKGSIFVTSPGGIHQISSTGERIATLMRREEIGFSPTCACYDVDDSLLVLTGQSNKMVAFQLIESNWQEIL